LGNPLAPADDFFGRLVTTPMLCRAASCSRWTLRRWVRDQIIPPPIRINGSCLRWPIADVMAALKGRQGV
jgi:predicted DNA-binding transcriptional regulator AlpA